MIGTILGSVASLRATVGQACSTATKNLPELAENKNRAVRIHFEGLCTSNATRLQAVESHLDSALTDWERFIKQNCDGPECADVGRRLAVLRARLDSTGTIGSPVGCTAAPSDSLSKAESKLEHRTAHGGAVTDHMDLIVSGVTTRRGGNGKWRLHQIAPDYWDGDGYVLRKESHGWFLEDKDDADNYFFRKGPETPCGVYSRCDVCPDDGTAFVSMPVTRPALHQTTTSLALPAPSSSDHDQVGPFAAWVMELDPYLQHAMNAHGVSKDVVLAAVTSAKTMTDYSTMLGLECPNIISACAIPGLNLVRGFVGEPRLEFDEKLWEEVCKKSAAASTSATPSTSHSERAVETDI